MNNPLLEPLTRREQEIMDLLAEGLTSREMAERLTLAVSSVRWYIQQIYGKLGVNGKRQAITRAGELGLLRSEGSNSAIIKKMNPNNLPAQLTSFIGRETEIKTLGQLFTAGPTRLVTLTGSGGVGKTRLAIRAAEELLDDFVDGIWLVELAPLNDPRLVVRAAATELGFLQTPGQSATQGLCEHLRTKHLLLILDNCEQVVNAAAELADNLLRCCPYLRILATSREILGISGETPFRCPSLSLPDPDHSPPLAELAHNEAIRLFAERAHTISPGFTLTSANAALIVRICQRLDGIPLAIELAAARVRLLSIEQIASRLEEDFHLLTGGSRIALPRHQTLKALIDWSFHLLSEKERRFLLRLSIFAGGWTLEAAENVCADKAGGWLPSEEILDLLGQLVDKSLVVMAADTPRDSLREYPRYRMLETIRQYAREKMENDPSIENGEAAAVRQRHLEYFLWLALQAEPHLRGKGQRVWLDRLDMELDNFRLALGWALANDIEKGLQLAAAIEWFWHIRNHWTDGVGWLERLLAAAVGGGTEAANEVDWTKAGNQLHPLARSMARGKALNAFSNLKTNWVGDENVVNVVPLLEEARSIFEEHCDLNQRDLATSLGLLAQMDKDLDRAIFGTMQALDLLRKEKDDFLLADELQTLALLNVSKGDLAQARTNAEECLSRFREAEDGEGIAISLGDLGMVELISGNLNLAARLLGDAQSLFDSSGNRIYSAKMMDMLANVALSLGEYSQAIQKTEASLAISIEMNIREMMMDSISYLGWEAWALKDYDQAISQCEKGLALARELRPNLAVTANYILGRVAISRGDYLRADAYLKELILSWKGPEEHFWINIFWSPYGFMGMQFPTFEAIHALGVLAAVQHQARRSATLFGAQAELYDWVKNTFSLAERDEYEQALISARTALGEKAFVTAWEEGQAMNVGEAVQFALGKN
jgi:predicted ATPase/DNA-binding CsgD family transcriptional regulator